MKNIVLMIILCLIVCASFCVVGLTADEEGVVPSADQEVLQRLSNMPYDNAVQELEGLEPSSYIYHVMSLSALWGQKGDPRMTQMYLDLALTTARMNQMVKDEVVILYYYAKFLDFRDNFQEALEYFDKGIMLLQSELEEPALLKEFLRAQADLLYGRGEYERSREVYHSLLARLSGEEDELLKANVLCDVAMLCYYLDEHEQGVEGLHEALAIYQKRQYSKGIADCYKIFGTVAGARKDYEGSEGYYLQALEEYRQAGDSHGQANCLYNLGVRFRDQKVFDKSIEFLQEAVGAYTFSSSPVGVGIANMEMGYTYLLNGEYDKSETHLGTAYKVLERTDSIRRLAQTEEYFCELYTAVGKAAQANEYCQRAIDHYSEVNLPNDVVRMRGRFLDEDEYKSE